MSTTIPAGRISLPQRLPRQYAAMRRLSESVGLDHALANLLHVRASQINRCAFCLDMHWKDARAAGETEERLYMLSAWRESPLYSEAERAALALCEAMTLIAQAGVSDEVWEAAQAHFDEEELGRLTFSITTINAWNRLMIASATEPGHYQPGMFG